MATTIVTKSGSGAPTASDLVAGELAVDLTNKRLYTEDSGGTVLELGTNPTTLAVDTDTLVVDATNNRVGIGTTTPAQPIEILKTSAGAVVPMIQLRNGSTSAGSGTSIKFMHSTVSNATSGTCELESIRYSGNLGALTFKTSNNGGTVTERMRVDDTGVGIGTSSPSYALHVYETPANGAYSATTNMAPTARFHATESTTGAYTAIQLSANNANSALGWWNIGTVSTSTNYDNHLVFQTRTGASTYAERMRIDASGNVGIGVVPESYQALYRALQVGNTALIGRHSGGTSETYLTANSYYDGAWKYIVSDEASVISQSAGVISFLNAASGTADATISWSEAMRIDVSGNLLVGTTATLPAETNVEGIALSAGSYGGLLSVSRAGNRAATFNRIASDGDIAEFRKDGTTVGSIGTLTGNSYIGTGDTGLLFAASVNSVLPHNTTTNAARDAEVDLGYSSGGTQRRFKDLYLSGVATLGGASHDSTKTIKAATVGTSSSHYVFEGTGTQTGADGRVHYWALTNTNNASAFFVYAQNSGGNCFNIRGDGDVENSNNSYGAISDEKLKENVAEASSQWDDLKAVQVRKYSFKSDNLDSPNQLGVIAQELEASGMGGLVKESPDVDMRTGEDLGTTTKTVKYSVLYMKAVKALQEAMDRIETLEAKVAQLES